jgi:hypothetical protein
LSDDIDSRSASFVGRPARIWGRGSILDTRPGTHATTYILQIV